MRRDVVAAGGQNFPPPNGTALSAAITAAPGEPREVRAGDDALDQVCGCSMALDKTKLPNPAPFDPDVRHGRRRRRFFVEHARTRA